ncbi:S8 family peptidase [Streptomyces sp. VB1]|uniref:S8 family peptidase n=1 Tax=Streptomyces sp. VB1 TaxID=2986803 RepID=UPI002241A600|nr:S8 family serine peptidase [Streptomyces sp. VB1]UZI33879.1 S8 family serine peptidase [Streptomyces sp. VB1]
MAAAVVPAATANAAPTAPAATAQAPSAVAAERLVVTYKAAAAEARSDKAAAADAADKAEGVDQSLRFDGRMPTGEVVVDLDGMQSKAEVAEVMAEFRADPNVLAVDPDIVMRSMAEGASAPNDTDYAKQWDLFESTGGMNVPDSWPKSTGKGVNVAVVDTGYVQHSDLHANVTGGYDFIVTPDTSRDGDGSDPDPTDEGDYGSKEECESENDETSSWHGTHVAGTIAALTNNDKGLASVAPDAKVTPVRALGKCGIGSSLDIAIGVLWAAGVPLENWPANPDPAEVINLSLGSKSACPAYWQRTIDRAVARGATVVVAAGNSKEDAAKHSPANCDNVITVAATDRGGDRAFYSNFGDTVDVSAPGGETRRESDTPGTVTTPANGIWSTVNAGQTTATTEAYKPMMGTSMAAPHVAGLAAQMKAAKPSLTPAQIEQLIKDNARPLPGTCTGGCGTGIADATKTLAAVTGSGTTPTTPATHTNNTRVAIPDNGAAVTSAITVTGRTGNAPADLKVAVDIEHKWRGDLVIDLVSPVGTVHNLKPFSSRDDADNVKTTYTVNAADEKAAGTWKLRVQDKSDLLDGHINSWNLTL